MQRSDQPAVIVVGAGVAGCAVALHLARRGHSVRVLERGSYPRETVCGEGLMPHGVAEVEGLGMLDDLQRGGAQPFRGIAYHLDELAALGAFPDNRPHPAGLGVRRLLFDRLLAERCAREPAIVFETETRVRKVSVGRDGVEVQTDSGPVHGRLLIGADGRQSLVRRTLGMDDKPRGPKRYGIRGHFRIAGPPPDRVEVHVTPRCELYVTPTGSDEINIAVLCDEATAKGLGGDLTGGYLELVHECAQVASYLHGAAPVTPPTLTGPLRQGAKHIAGDRVLLVGDAAGFIDAITGEGMSTALIGARLAAEVADKGLRDDRLDARSLAPYERRYRRQTRSGTWLTEVILWGIRHRGLARAAVRLLGRHPRLFGRVLGLLG